MWVNPEWDRLSGPSFSTHSFNSICFEAEILTLSRSIEFVLHYKRHFSHDREAYYVGCLVFFLPFLPGLSWESRLFLNVSAARSGLLSHSLDHSISWLMMCCFESRNWSLGNSLICSSWLGSGLKSTFAPSAYGSDSSVWLSGHTPKDRSFRSIVYNIGRRISEEISVLGQKCPGVSLFLSEKDQESSSWTK